VPDAKQLFDLTGKVAIVTGSTKGIGRAMASGLAQAGASIVVCSRKQDLCENVANEIAGETGATTLGLACHVGDWDAIPGFVETVVGRFGRIDVLVNNAGVMTRPAPMTELDVKKWDYTIAVNLRGPFLITQAVLPIMIKQKSGSIINVSSSIGRGAYANFIAYATSKWGLEGFTQNLAAELRSSHILVNSVEPGYVATKLTGFHGSKPESVTDVFVFLASDESKGVTGKMLSSSGWKSQIK